MGLFYSSSMLKYIEYTIKLWFKNSTNKKIIILRDFRRFNDDKYQQTNHSLSSDFFEIHPEIEIHHNMSLCLS